MTGHESRILRMAVLAITIVVGWVSLLSGGPSGYSFGINAITTPAPRMGPVMKGFDFGPYATPYDTTRFLEVQQLCDPSSSDRYTQFPPNQHECCRRMCNDACLATNDQRPGTCLTPCLRGCMKQSSYQIP